MDTKRLERSPKNYEVQVERFWKIEISRICCDHCRYNSCINLCIRIRLNFSSLSNMHTPWRSGIARGHLRSLWRERAEALTVVFSAHYYPSPHTAIFVENSKVGCHALGIWSWNDSAFDRRLVFLVAIISSEVKQGPPPPPTAKVMEGGLRPPRCAC